MSNEPNIRNRVAGAVVLVSLAVIFLPLILDGKKKNQILESYIPEKPKSGEIILINVDESVNAKQVEQAEQPAEDESTTNTESLTISVDEITEARPEQAKKPETKPEAPTIQAPKPQPKRDNRPNYTQEGFLVQMGSFSSQTNAQALVNKMRAANHTAYFKAGEAGGKRIYRVFSGPYIKRNQAETALESLRTLANVSPIVVVFDPIKHAQR